MLQDNTGLEIRYWILFPQKSPFVVYLQEHAYESSQKYKEGKYIIELIHMVKDNGWAQPWADQQRRRRNGSLN